MSDDVNKKLLQLVEQRGTQRLRRRMLAVALGSALAGATGARAVGTLPSAPVVAVHDVHLVRDTSRGGDGGIEVMVYAHQLTPTGKVRLEPAACESEAFNRAAEAFFTGAGAACAKAKAK